MDTPIYENIMARWTGDGPELIKREYEKEPEWWELPPEA